MKNNQNSLINKFADIHSELLKLNKRISNIEITQEKSVEEMKNEILQRQGTDKKSFQQNELLNNKIFSIRKGLEDLSLNMNQQFEQYKEKNEDHASKSNEKIMKTLGDKINKIESLDTKFENIFKELTKQSEENNMKSKANIQILNDNILTMKSEFDKQSSIVDILERKIDNYYESFSNDIKNIYSEVKQMKYEIDNLKVFKDSCSNNLKEISNHFHKK